MNQIYVLTTNCDKIEEKGLNITLAISPNLKMLQSLADEIPVSMGAKYPSATITTYDPIPMMVLKQNVRDLKSFSSNKQIYRFGGSPKWFESFSDYEDYMRSQNDY